MGSFGSAVEVDVFRFYMDFTLYAVVVAVAVVVVVVAVGVAAGIVRSILDTTISM